LLKRGRMLFIPKMAIMLTVVAFTLLLILISGIYLGLFNAQFLSIAIFPMLILSTLVEKFISAKTESDFSSATVIMGETLLVAVIAYFIAGGEIDLGIVSFKFEFVKTMMLTYPEIIFLLLIIDIFLGRWSGLRVLERIRFREILRHIEE
ncbi:MAG: 7TM domain-containing protein, partial [Patescibacteria group bacterium]